MSRRAPRLAALAAMAALLSAHVGSPDVYYRGMAGPYDVSVVVQAPPVIPGRATVLVTPDSEGVQSVRLRPVFWQTGTRGAPPPDDALPIAGAPRTYRGQLWLMTGGSYSVEVTLDGARGRGSVNVPLPAMATAALPLSRGLSLLLAVLATFLVIGALSIIASAAREATLPPRETPDRRRLARARLVTAGSALLLGVGLAGGKAWWQSEDADHRAQLFHPFHISSTVAGTGARTLSIAIDDSTWRGGRFTPLIRDHGKLMHAFLVRVPGMDAFAHLHPVTGDTVHFDSALPWLPAGRYRLYADIVHASGFSQTMIDTLAIAAPSAPARAASDADDSWAVATAAADVGGDVSLGGGWHMRWERSVVPLVAGADAGLRFVVRDAAGRPAPLAPYLGMMGHAIVMRDDGGVFVHLHPMGTIAIAAQERFDRRARGDTSTITDATSSMPTAPAGEVSFPYAFPRPGRYRIWVQVKRGSAVETAVFNASVSSA